MLMPMPDVSASRHTLSVVWTLLLGDLFPLTSFWDVVTRDIRVFGVTDGGQFDYVPVYSHHQFRGCGPTNSPPAGAAMVPLVGLSIQTQVLTLDSVSPIFSSFPDPLFNQ